MRSFENWEETKLESAVVSGDGTIKKVLGFLRKKEKVI